MMETASSPGMKTTEFRIWLVSGVAIFANAIHFQNGQFSFSGVNESLMLAWLAMAGIYQAGRAVQKNTATKGKTDANPTHPPAA